MEDNNNSKMCGEVVFFDGRSYGFIKGTDCDYFYHLTGVEPGYIPESGDIVTFTPSERKGRPFARNVCKIKE